ncbi:MAG: hypothetical protein ABR977_04435 [Candidatus Dormibacteria bacterium]
MSQQICPSCATANSTFASVCRSCSVPLEPRSLPSDTSGGFAIYGADGQAAVQAAPASARPTDYAPAPPSAAGGNGHWPAEKLTPSSLQKWASDGWTGVPRAQVPRPVRPASRGSWASPAPVTPESDGGPAPAAPPAPPAAPPPAPPAPRGPLAFHLDVGAGSALAASGTPAAFPPPAPPAGAPDDGGGRGWGVREQKPAPSSAWAVQPAAYTPPAPYIPPGAHPSYGPAPAGAMASPGRRPRVGVQIFFLSLIAVLITAGIFIYLMNGMAAGVGSGTHTLSTPASLGGAVPDKNAVLQLLVQPLQAEIQADAIPGSATIRQTVAGFYGAPGASDADYFLVMVSTNAPLTASDLSQADSHLLAVSSVQTANGVSFHCGKSVINNIPSICTWVDGNVFGVVQGSSDVSAAATMAAAEQARIIAEH